MLGIKSLIVDREDRIGDNWRTRYHQCVPSFLLQTPVLTPRLFPQYPDTLKRFNSMFLDGFPFPNLNLIANPDFTILQASLA